MYDYYMAAVAALRYPKKSHRKKVFLPRHSPDLAEFFGIMMGDGGINNPWQANITLNALKDAEYADYIIKLSHDLFGVLPAKRKRKNRQALIVSLTSTTLVDFLVEHGLVRGNKLKQGLRIPNWILKKRAYKAACIRGLVDTDGCLFIHVHKIRGKEYKNIGLCFASYSYELIQQVAEIFEEFGIFPHISLRGTQIYLYKAEVIAKYLKVFGSSNPRISRVYQSWRGARVV